MESMERRPRSLFMLWLSLSFSLPRPFRLAERTFFFLFPAATQGGKPASKADLHPWSAWMPAHKTRCITYKENDRLCPCLRNTRWFFFLLSLGVRKYRTGSEKRKALVYKGEIRFPKEFFPSTLPRYCSLLERKEGRGKLARHQLS